MAFFTNKSEPEAIKKAREKIEKENKTQTTKENKNFASNENEPDAIKKARENILKENPDYEFKSPSNKRGGNTLDTSKKDNPATKPTTEIATEPTTDTGSYKRPFGFSSTGTNKEQTVSPEKAGILKKIEELENSKVNFGDFMKNLLAGPFGTEEMQKKADTFTDGGYNEYVDNEIAKLKAELVELDYKPSYSTSEKIRDSAGYVSEKILGGLVGGVEDTGDFLASIIPALGWGVSSGFGLWENKVSDKFENDFNVINESDWVDTWKTDERWEATPQGVKNWGWLPETIGNLLPFMAETAYTGGGAAVDDLALAGKSALDKAVAFLGKPNTHFGMSAAGTAEEAAIEKGANPLSSAAYGTAVGAVEMATERLFGGFAGTDIGDSVIDFAVKNPHLRKALNILAEGLEEDISAGADPVLQRITGVDTNAEWASWSDYAESGSHGIILSVVMNIATMPLQKYGKVRVVQDINKASEALNEVIEDNNLKMQPLSNNATEEEILQRQKELQVVAIAYNNAVEKALQNEQQDAETSITEEPDTLEKAAMDVVTNRNNNTVQEVINELKADDTQDIAGEATTNVYDVGNTIPTPEQNTVKTALEAAEAQAEESAFKAGKLNVPREHVSLETPAQEEAYNKGRIEHINNMNSDASARDNVDISSEMEYTGNESAAAPYEADIDDIILYGSGHVDGKERIAEFYKGNPSKAEAVEFLKKEYGIGGRTVNLPDGTRTHEMHNAKGIEIDDYNGKVRRLSWSDVDNRIRKLIESGEYASHNKTLETRNIIANDKVYSDLAEKLRTHNRADTEHFVFRVQKVGDKWQGKVDAAEMSAAGGYMIADARGVHYTSETFNTREEAVEDIIAVATNNRLLEDNKVKGENTNVRQETISDTSIVEHQRVSEETISREVGSTRQRISKKIKEILRKSTVKRDDNSLDGRGTARIERKETAEAFEERAFRDGYTYVIFSKTSIAYKYSPKSEWNENAKEAAEIIESLGLTVVVFEGELRSNNRGVSEISTEGSTVGTGDNLTIFISSKLDVDGMETAYHEAFHALRRNNNAKYHHKMIDIVSSGVNSESESFEKFVSSIVELYSYEVKDVSTERFSAEVTEEFYSWYIGSIYAKKNEHSSDMLEYINEFSNVGTIKGQLDAVFAEIKTKKEVQNDVHEGVLGRESDNDNGVRESEPVQKVEEKRNSGTEDKQSIGNVATENGTDVQAVERETPAERSDNSGSDDNGVREPDNSNGDSGAGTVGNDNVDVRESAKSKDYVISKTVAEEIDTSAPSMEDNIKAIETLHELETSGKAPTKAQQTILAKFKGWGGLSMAFYGQSRSKLQQFMSDSEISAAQGTVNDAYFTPTNIIDGVYKALLQLGFEGGNILEPSMGVGNFFGRMPKSVKDNSSLYGVEIDTISGRIAQHLYPSANIEIAPFQDVAYKDGAFDLIIGNVPFGEVKYKYKGSKYLIHDYFFVKAMDKLKDGGVIAFLTSRGTLDKMDSKTRAELNKQGNLIAAYRLPSSVFTRSAGASPVTDLIIMQKSADTNGEKFVNLGSVDIMGDNFSINEYFVNNPQNIIGELTKKWNYRSKKYELDVRATGNVPEQLTKAIKKLPQNLINGTQTVGNVDVTENTEPMQTFVTKDNGTVEYIDAQTGEVKQIKGKSADAAKAYIKLKEVYQDLIDATLNEKGQAVIEGKRKELNAEYDSFVKKYGTLEKNKKVLTADNDFFKISGLEVYDTKTKSIIKSEMFTKDTLGKRKPKRADSTLDALSISIGESGGVDLARISELTGLPESEVIKQLDDRIVYTPDGTYELNEVYLSGNVREKYEAVKGKKGFEKNEKMLKAVIPEDIPAKNITPQFGSPWIQPKYVAQFLKDTLNLYGTPTVNYDTTTGTWAISGDTWGDTTLMTHKFGTRYLDAIKLAEKALNMRRIVVKDSEGKVIVTETRAAQQKAEDIKAAFEEWCFKDSGRRQDLVSTFNEKFNSHRNMDFSELSKYLTFDGLTETFKLRDYQKRAVARAIFNGNTLLAHGVGTGKTAEMIAIAMELKRMGIAKKNMMVVPPHKVADFRNDILKMYPSAKVIMLEKGANATQRQRFYAQVAANDFDIVVIPHSSFGMLDVSADTKAAFVSNQIAELEEVLTAAQEAEKGKIDGRFIKQLENQKKRLEEKLKFVTETEKDNGNTFEELGVDSLFVDEAHNFKNLPFSSKLSRVAGVSINQSNNKTRASRAENMFMITDYLNRNNGRITFGTATPITNSMSEIYNMTRFLRPDILEDSGIQSFDAWASMFGSIVNQAEVDPSGRNMRMKERFSKFKNVPQMVEQFRRMADILKTGDVIQELPVAERIDVVNEPNDIQEEFLDIIDKMIDEIRHSGQNAKHNMLEVTTAGQMAAIDLRFVEPYFEGKYTKDELNLPNSRIVQVANKVIKEYNDSNATKGTQFVFCDVGVSDDPSKKYNLHVYGDLINRLVAGGIPQNEIAVAQDFEDKADLSAKVNTGEIRVLIGSTAVMGEGMNAQNKAVALHHMTVPARPSDIEQREGRIIRYGNENKNVRIYRYIQEKSYDSYQWQMQERKASFINQALSGGTVEELEEMSDFQLTAREAKAIASGNPLLLEKIEIEDKLNKLKSLRNKFNTDKLEMKDRLAMLPNRIGKMEKNIANTKADIDIINANATKDFEITFGKTKYTERAKAAEALEKTIKNAPRNGTSVLIGKYKGLEVYYSSSIGKGIQYVLKGNGEYTIEGGESAIGNITRIINAVDKIASNLETAEAVLKNHKAEVETLKKEVNAEFPKAKELEELQTKLNEIDTALGINVSEVDMSEVVVGEDDADGDTDEFQEGEDTDKLAMWTTKRVGDEVKPKSISEIVASIEHEFGINVTTGHIRGKGVLGTYTPKDHGIKTKIANNLPVISHELGHYFERTLDIKAQLTEELRSELKANLDERTTENYTDEQLSREGVAEYVRRFLQNRETAAIDYPKFNDFFLKLLPGKDLAKLQQLADDINAYYSLDADTATSAIRLREEGGVDLRTPMEKLKDAASSLYQAWYDSNNSIKRFDKATGSNAYIFASNAAYSDAIAGQIITGNLTDKNGQYISSGLKTVLHGIDLNVKHDEYRLFGEYLTVKHGPERLREGMRVFADDRKNSTAFMERRQSELETQYPQFKEASERLYTFIKQFYQAWGVETELISEATLNSWGERWEYYVPFNRVMEKGKGNIGAKRGFANQNSTIKKARGSGRDIQHPVDNLIDNIVKMVNAGTRNHVMITITDSAERLGADATFIEKVPMPMTATKIDMAGVKDTLTTWLEESDMDTDSKDKASGIVNSLDDILIQYGRGKAFGNVVTVLRNGKPQAWKINDVGLLESLTSLSPKTMDGILDAYAVASRFMTSNITGNNLVWSIFSNLPRDFATFFTYSKNKNVAKMAKGVGEAYLNKAKGDKADPMYKEFLAMGGGKTSAYTADRNLAKNARKKLSDRKFDPNPLNWIGFASDMIESGPRFATYKLMRQAGMTPQEAFYEAMDITVNFRRSGRISKELNKVVPFFNASMQGLDKFRRWITAEEVKGAERKKAIVGRTLSYMAVSAALAAIVYAINNGDEEKEEEYEQLSTYTKNSFWVFPIGDGKYFAIPKPREIGVLSSFFETCLEYGVGENDHAFDEFYAYASENFLPAIANDIAQVGSKGLVETGVNIVGSFGLIGIVGYLGANRDFLGRPIVASGLQNLEKKDQYTDRTSKIAYWLGQATGGSPEQIDYFFQQILGGWWKGQKALFPVGEKNKDYTVGVANTYIKDNQYSTDLTNWLYDHADTTARAKKSNPTDIEKAIMAKWDSNMTDFYGTYYKKAKNNSSATASRSTRQLVLDMIREYQKGIDGNFKTSLQEAVEAVCVSNNSTEYLPSVMSAEVTDGNGKKHNLSDVQYVEYQTDYLRLYWETVEDTMTNNMSTSKKAQILLSAKQVAREQATERTLNRIGATSSDFATTYKGIENDDLTEFLAGVSEANSDKSLRKSEVVNVISELDIDNDDAWTLYLSKYDSKSALEAEKHGIDAKLYMSAVVDMGEIKPDYDKNGKPISGSRRKKVEKYLNSVCDSYKEYLFLLGTEFESIKDDHDYLQYFGK